jgi:hypothetical protein
MEEVLTADERRFTQMGEKMMKKDRLCYFLSHL